MPIAMNPRTKKALTMANVTGNRRTSRPNSVWMMPSASTHPQEVFCFFRSNDRPTVDRPSTTIQAPTMMPKTVAEPKGEISSRMPTRTARMPRQRRNWKPRF